MMDLFDFDGHLNHFAQTWYEEHADELTPEELENAVEDIFGTWSETRIEEIGVSPKQYFEKQSDEDLFSLFAAYLEKRSVPSVLTDELSDRPTLASKMEKLLIESKDGETVELLMALLEELGDTKVYSEYLKWLLDESSDDDLVMHASEIMQENADMVADELEKAIPNASMKVRERISDLLVYARRSEEGFKLISELFLAGKDRQLYAAYLGMYGDERAIDLLKEAALTCDYPTYMEIRNSAERLGADWDIERDFSNDPLYQKIQGAYHVNDHVGNNPKE